MRARHRQPGYALIALVAILGLVAISIFVGQLASASSKNARDSATADALAQAKAALIGRAVIDLARPGSLPCPDIDNDGSADSVGAPASCPAPYHAGAQCPSYIGRLPWRTLGIPDLRDGTGERLWYALSCSLRDFASAQPVNSSSAGLLSVGAQGSIAAVIIAPGSPLAGQAGRPGNSAADYLEGRNADAIANDFEDAQPSAVFNDRLLSVSRDELFAKVSPRIVAEIAGRLQPVPIAQPLLDYSAAHGGLFPWADTDNDGQQDSAATSGKVPYLDLTFPVLVGIDVEDVLKDNGWFSIASYDLSIDQSSATLSVGSATRNLP